MRQAGWAAAGAGQALTRCSSVTLVSWQQSALLACLLTVLLHAAVEATSQLEAAASADPGGGMAHQVILEQGMAGLKVLHNGLERSS